MRFLIPVAALALVAFSTDANAQCGSLTTTFASNNGFAGNMVDITAAVDLEITDMDLNNSALGMACDYDVWYRNGTSFGNETNPLADWVLLGSYSGTGAGLNNATNIDMAGNGYTFASGAVTGLFVDNTSYGINGNRVNYTNGQFQYSNADLTIDTNCGKGSGGFAGSTFFPRALNATINYCTSGGGGPTLTVTGLVAGGTAFLDLAGAGGGATVGLAYSLTGGGPNSTIVGPCGALTVDMDDPINVLAILTADAAGAASYTAAVPAGTTGVNVWLQAADVTNCTLSNGVAATIG